MGTHTVLINIDLNPSSQMFKEFLFICISLTPEQAVNFGGASNDAEKTVKQKCQFLRQAKKSGTKFAIGRSKDATGNHIRSNIVDFLH